MENLKIREFENTIIQYINSVDLNIEVKRLVVRNILHQIDDEADKILKIELQEREEKENGN